MSQAEINRLRILNVSPQKLFINGKHVDAKDGAMHEVRSPIDGKVFSTIALASKEDADQAVIAARASFESGVWSKAAPAERKKVMHRILFYSQKSLSIRLNS